jgi:hypothetical protein
MHLRPGSNILVELGAFGVQIAGMARAKFLLPSVFVGCPYRKPFPFSSFQKTLSKIPIRFYYADTNLRTKQLLSILETYINAVDYCIFDLSTWNPNVSLELGLAQGLGAEYYILVSHKQSKDVPSDIKGLQRIEYGSVDGFETDDLLPLLTRYLVKSHTHPRKIWDKLTSPNREKKYYYALSVLSHFKDNKRLSSHDRTQLSRGLYLRKETQDEVLGLLEAEGYLAAIHTKGGARITKRIYPEPLNL